MLLSENFWRDPDSNRWREPTDEEREKMNDDRSIRVLHDAERYVAGSLHRTAAQSKIDVSYLTDILSSNEGGPPLDLSVPAVFRQVCPKINFPVAEIRRVKDALLARIEEVPRAADKIVERWGRPDDWGRGQVAALVLLAQYPDWTLSDIWPDEIDPATQSRTACGFFFPCLPNRPTYRLLARCFMMRSIHR
jgi:hypothetical protein